MLQWITLGLAALAAWNALKRLWALDWRRHRWGVLIGYMALGIVAVLAGSAAAQQQADTLTLAAVVLLDAYLLASDRHWRQGVPHYIHRSDPL